MIRCETCRYNGMCIRQTHTMANVDDCDRYEEYEEKPHGEWVKKGGAFYTYECSVCGGTTLKEWRTDFCPNCGADMRKLECCPCNTCKHFGENGAIDPYGEEYCPIDHECENASLYEKEGDEK